MEAVAPYPFFYHVFALNKDPQRLYGPGFDHKDSLYRFAARLVFENARPYLDNATVIVDESGDRNFRNELATYLRRRISSSEGRRLIKKVKVQRSGGNNLIQLADYVASISNRSLGQKSDAEELRSKYLAAHELTRRVWP